LEDIRYYQLYDNGLLQSKSTDFDLRGKMTNWEDYTYRYDSLFNVVFRADTLNGIFKKERMPGLPRLSVAYTYDNKGEVLTATELDEDRIFEKSFFKYDDKGNKTELKEFDGGGLMTKYYTYKYDNNGRLIRKNDLTITPQATFYIYNENGDVSIENEVWDEFKIAYLYKYDSNGNWVEKTEKLHEKDPVSITKRTITYF
jgi:hypothetical protein